MIDSREVLLCVNFGQDVHTAMTVQTPVPVSTNTTGAKAEKVTSGDVVCYP